MIKLIIGNKGSGKTKKLIDAANEAVKNSSGNVVCVEKGDALRFNISSGVRLIDTENYKISGYGEYYAMLCGIAASNHDVTHIFGDATLKIGGGVDGLDAFLERLKDSDIEYVFTISCDEADLPARIFEIAEKY
ncbi:MAG: hypothetical protein J6Q67_05445 [Clostridia bacterium]|nr:hypothetical protein [Clostridia bacterium]